MIPTREELERLRDATTRAKQAMEKGIGWHNINQLHAMSEVAHPAMLLHLLACEAALRRLVLAEWNYVDVAGTNDYKGAAVQAAFDEYAQTKQAARALIGEQK